MRRKNQVGQDTMGNRRRDGRVALLAAVALLVALAAGPAAAQTQVAASPLDSAALGERLRMHTLLEKTIFKVDVLTLDIWLGTEDARRIEEIVAGGSYSSEVADRVAEVAIRSEDALVRLEFLRDVSFEQFLDGIDENLRLVARRGIISDDDYRELSENLPRWFAFLAERGIRAGDEIIYRIHGDALRTQYVGADGQLLLDQTDFGASARLSVLGSYFVEKSEYRKGLVSSLFQGS